MNRSSSPRRDRDDLGKRRKLFPSRNINTTSSYHSDRPTPSRSSYDNNHQSGKDRDRDSRDRDSYSFRAHDREFLDPLQSIRPISSELKAQIEAQAHKIDKEIVHGGKDARELFVGNVIDEDASENTLKLFMNTAMRKIGLVHPSEEPVVNCRMSNKFCFIEFGTSFDCTKALNLNGISFKDSFLKLGRPAKYPGPSHQLLTWQDLVPSTIPPVVRVASSIIDHGAVYNAAVIPHPSTKTYREIFVGNTEFEMSDILMREFIGAAMQKMGLSHSGNENPIMNVKLNGKFAFLEMRTSVDAANVLNLNGIPFVGSNLNLVRPTKYDGGLGGMEYFKWDALYKSWVKGELRMMTAGPPSRILSISNMATQAHLSDTNLYYDVIEETRLECAQFGIVRSVILPRNLVTPISSNVLHNHYNSITKTFVEMHSVEQAVQALLGLKGRSFDGRILDVKFYPEEAFRSMNYTHTMPEQVFTLSHGAVSKDRVFTQLALSKIEKEMMSC